MEIRLLKFFSLFLCIALILCGCGETKIIKKKSRKPNSSAASQNEPDTNPEKEQSTVKNESSVVSDTKNESSSKNTVTSSSDKETSRDSKVSKDNSSVVSNFDNSVSQSPDTPSFPTYPSDSIAAPVQDEKYPQRGNTEYYYKSRTVEIDMKQYKTPGNNIYWLAHIVIKSPDQIKGGLANGSFGGFEKPTDASKRLNWILGINGSYFDWSTGKPKGDRPVIKNGVSVGTPNTVTTGNEICLLKDGTIYSPEKGYTAEDLIAFGVVESWTTYDPLMISDGEKRRTEVINFTHPVGSKNYPRTAIGMVKPCEYYILVAGDYHEETGVSFVKMQDVFYNLGCVYARSFDGGGSSSLVFKNQLLNVPKGGSERAVVDFLYFTE